MSAEVQIGGAHTRQGTARRWWEGAVLYQVYVRSFVDSDGDGFGDLPGLLARLDHLQWLGIDAIWLSPTMPSPDTDWGYDVSDYFGVHPELGTMEDLEALVEGAEDRGLRVLLDLVPNHTSAEHPWFVEASERRDAGHRDFYVWADPSEKGGPPNNWLDATGESAWTLDEASGQYYLHNFLPSQPDLNWWNPDVHEAFEEILRFWFDKGIAGFRIDVAHGLYKDAALRDNPPVSAADGHAGKFGFEQRYSMNRPETHGVYRSWRRLAESYQPGRLLLGETWVLEVQRLASYLGSDDELQLAFNFPFAFSAFEAPALATVVAGSLAALGPACPVWTASNHDIGRFPTRWAADDERRVRLGLLVLTMLPGTVVLYYGDELGMTDVDVPVELQRDPMTRGNRGGQPNRDRCRTPFVWSDGPGAGFCAPGTTPWLPLGRVSGGSLEQQRRDERSVVHLTRGLLALRRQHLGAGIVPYEELVVDEDRWIFRVGPLTVAANFASTDNLLELPRGRLLLSSTLERSPGEREGPVGLAPYEGVVVLG